MTAPKGLIEREAEIWEGHARQGDSLYSLGIAVGLRIALKPHRAGGEVMRYWVGRMAVFPGEFIWMGDTVGMGVRKRIPACLCLEERAEASPPRDTYEGAVLAMSQGTIGRRGWNDTALLPLEIIEQGEP